MTEEAAEQPEEIVPTCRCGHPRTSHGLAGGRCGRATGSGYCGCPAFNDEPVEVTVERDLAWEEILGYVCKKDREYAAKPDPPWRH